MRKIMLIALLFAGIFPLLPNNASAAPKHQDFVDWLRKDNTHQVRHFLGDGGPYSVFVRSEKVSGLLKSEYSYADMRMIDELTSGSREIKVMELEWGFFIQAASFESKSTGESTHYDAVWMRDTIWAYLALKSRGDAKAAQILLTQIDYIASPPQMERMNAAITDPSLVTGANGQMNAVHIRFDPGSPDFADVMENGKPQQWNHKQNDALGLLLDATLDAVNDGTLTTDDLEKNGRMAALARLVAYLDAVNFYEMEDSGAWEEIPRRNTSSVGLVVSALENLDRTAKSDGKLARQFVGAFERESSKLGLDTGTSPANIARMIDKGYGLIEKQLGLGGESPGYAKSDARFRTADAALLNLIYPAKLSRLSLEQKYKIMNIVKDLVGDFGIRRYFNDNYQSANFWFNDIRTDAEEESYAQRRRNFVPGTEAQWFFDSWYAKAWLMLYRDSRDKSDLANAYKYTNRALGQFSGRAGKIGGGPSLGADGMPVPDFALPESYNFIASGGELWVAPSPIIPLNWSKASMTLMLKEYETVLDQ